MTHYDEKDLYSGLGALHWYAITDTDPRHDEAFFGQAIRRGGGPALELGCGAGRLLLRYLAEGLEVSGCDISADMLAVCRQRAGEAGLEARLYEQAMQELDLPHRFRTIYIPCGSFVCVMDREQALQTLIRCRRHLDDGGQLVFNVFLPDHDYGRPVSPDGYPGAWTFKAEKSLPGDRRLVVRSRDTGLDPVEQTWHEERRYELYQGDTLRQTEVRAGQGRWYFRNELLWMLRLAGFRDATVTGDYTGEPFGPQHTAVMMVTATA
ncbi:MAG TPA: methyltransferase domain-containing protein [Micromonosporaceae bacterium]